MADPDALLIAYDDQMRPADASNLPVGVHAEADGPVVRIVRQHRGFVSGPTDLGLAGEALDGLIARQRDFSPPEARPSSGRPVATTGPRTCLTG